jgi:ParB-like chromosome segregation protein Spo0J
MAETQIRIEYIDVDEVQRWPRNPKDHDIHEIKKSFTRFGFVNPVIKDETTGKLVAGHGRIDALLHMRDSGLEPPRRTVVDGDKWFVPVLCGIAFDNPAEAEAYVIADNRLTEIGGWKKDLLNTILAEWEGMEDAVEGTGFDIVDIEKILGISAEIEEKKDKIPEKEYLVVIECASREDQSSLLHEFIERDLKCRALIS